MQRVFTFEDRKEVIRMYEEEELSAKQIAKRIGTVHSVVENWILKFRYNGTEGLKSKGFNNYYDEDFKNRVIAQVIEQNLSYTRVSAINNISTDTVRRWVLNYKKGNPMKKKTKTLLTADETAAIREKYKNVKDPEIRELMEKNYWLELENAALKKLRALVQERQEKEHK